MIPEVDLDDFRPLCSVPGHGTEALAYLHDSEEATHYITAQCPHCESTWLVMLACLTSAAKMERSLAEGKEYTYQCEICFSLATTSEMDFRVGRI